MKCWLNLLRPKEWRKIRRGRRLTRAGRTFSENAVKSRSVALQGRAGDKQVSFGCSRPGARLQAYSCWPSQHGAAYERKWVERHGPLTQLKEYFTERAKGHLTREHQWP
jgi:hypothetical protein